MEPRNDTLIPADTLWLADPDAQSVCRAIEAGGHRVLFVGGCVRNALLGLPGSDTDLSTDALPEEVITLAKVAGLKSVPTGIDFGTVTVVANGKPFEVTTFRRDVETDGRRAVVAFSKDISDDARRRDFTMNALYTTPKGQVIDPLGGLPDVLARRIRFIENASDRIREDYLRTLRFFRFSAWYADPAQGFDTDALDAIAQNLDGLETLSAERIGQEMRKLLAAPDPSWALGGMRSTGVLQVILPGADDRWIAPIVHFEHLLAVDARWMTRLAALGGTDPQTTRWLSKKEAREYTVLRDVAYSGASLSDIAYRHGRDVALTTAMVRAAMAETPPAPDTLAVIDRAAAAIFPIKAKHLMPAYEGPALGARLAELEGIWIASDFTLGKTELLNHG